MAGEGFKFTGKAVFSNRDLIKEAEAREVADRSELLFEQGQIDREDARRKARDTEDDALYETNQYVGDVRPEYNSYIEGKVSEFNDWTNKNYALDSDNLESRREWNAKKKELNDDIDYLKSRTKNINGIEVLNASEDADNGFWTPNEDGSLLWESNEISFLEGLKGGSIDRGNSLEINDIRDNKSPNGGLQGLFNDWTSGLGKSFEIKTADGTSRYSDGQKESFYTIGDKFLNPNSLKNDSGAREDYFDSNNKDDSNAIIRFLKSEKFANPTDLLINSLNPLLQGEEGSGYDEDLANKYSKWRVRDLSGNFSINRDKVDAPKPEKPEKPPKPKYPDLTPSLLKSFNPTSWDPSALEEENGIMVNNNIWFPGIKNKFFTVTKDDSLKDATLPDNFLTTSGSREVFVDHIVMRDDGEFLAAVKRKNGKTLAMMPVSSPLIEKSAYKSLDAKVVFQYLKVLKEQGESEEETKVKPTFSEFVSANPSLTKSEAMTAWKNLK